MSSLSESLVIAGPDDEVIPKLAEATARFAHESAFPREAARYDLIACRAETADGPSAPRSAVLDAFARRGHRVLCLDADAAADELVFADLRRDEAIDTAVVCVPTAAWGTAALRARRRWGWPILYDARADAATSGNGTADPVTRALIEQTDVALVSAETAARTANDVTEARPFIVADRRAANVQWPRLDRALRAACRRVSVVVVTCNGLPFTKLCLTSLIEQTSYPNYELIVVDNASTDGTPEYLAALARRFSHVRVLANAENLGFAAANNQALASATGDVLILLNNDTIVPPGWMTRLVRHLDDPTIGLLGPETNRTANEAQIAAPYRTFGEFVRFARERGIDREGDQFDLRMLAMFCTAINREVWEWIGPLDERYAVGMFEDEDYALRVRAAGYRVVCAQDVFVHHAYHATIGGLIERGEYGRVAATNRARFEAKWGICWIPHRLEVRRVRIDRAARRALNRPT